MASMNTSSPHADARRAVPRAPGFDNTLALFAEGYRFLPNRCEATVDGTTELTVVAAQ